MGQRFQSYSLKTLPEPASAQSRAAFPPRASSHPSHLPLSPQKPRSQASGGGTSGGGMGEPGSIPFAVVAPVSRADRPRRVKRENHTLDPPRPARYSGWRDDGEGVGPRPGAPCAGAPGLRAPPPPPPSEAPPATTAPPRTSYARRSLL